MQFAVRKIRRHKEKRGVGVGMFVSIELNHQPAVEHVVPKLALTQAFIISYSIHHFCDTNTTES